MVLKHCRKQQIQLATLITGKTGSWQWISSKELFSLPFALWKSIHCRQCSLFHNSVGFTYSGNCTRHWKCHSSLNTWRCTAGRCEFASLLF